MRRIGMAMAAILVLGATAPPAERVVSADGVVAASINGAGLRLRIDPAATAMPLIDVASARRAGLKPGMFGIGYMIGPERVAGRTAVAEIVLGGNSRIKRRIGWTTKPYAADVDGVIGPAGLDEPVIRFLLRAPISGERTITLPVLDQGGMAARWGERFAQIDVGGEPMRLRSDPYQPRTLATAGAAARLARVYRGTLSGDATPVTIAFGIARPVRAMTLAIGSLSISHLGVRTSDFGNATVIPEEGADPDEIVVTAKGKKRDPSHDRLSLGADDLARCSSIVFDKPARQIRLTCA